MDADGLPLHKDNQTVVKERIYIDKSKPDLLHDEITTIDNAFTRPWTVKRSYNRERNPVWPDYLCTEDNNHTRIGKRILLSKCGRPADAGLQRSAAAGPEILRSIGEAGIIGQMKRPSR